MLPLHVCMCVYVCIRARGSHRIAPHRIAGAARPRRRAPHPARCAAPLQWLLLAPAGGVMTEHPGQQQPQRKSHQQRAYCCSPLSPPPSPPICRKQATQCATTSPLGRFVRPCAPSSRRWARVGGCSRHRCGSVPLGHLWVCHALALAPSGAARTPKGWSAPRRASMSSAWCWVERSSSPRRWYRAAPPSGLGCVEELRLLTMAMVGLASGRR